MPMLALPPQPVPIISGFDYVTVDAQRRRVYAAHTASRALLVVDATTGKVLSHIYVGALHGVAVEPVSGHVFTGDGSFGTVSEIDPIAGNVVRTAKLDGVIDAIAYDPELGKIYADEDDGTRLFVVDAKTMTLIKTVLLPGHKPEYLAVNPVTHEVYQNIDDLAEVAVIDPKSLEVSRTFPTPELQHNHPLQYDRTFHIIVVSGTNGVTSSHAEDGRTLSQLATGRFDQCDLDPSNHIEACAGGGFITRIALKSDGSLAIVDRTPVHPSIHTTAVDPTNHSVWIVWSDGYGDFVQRLEPPAP